MKDAFSATDVPNVSTQIASPTQIQTQGIRRN
jgi:hypothetical protein